MSDIVDDSGPDRDMDVVESPAESEVEAKERSYKESAGACKSDGLSPEACRAHGHDAGDMKNGGYSAGDCKSAGFGARDCKDAGYSAGDCRDGGYSAGDCKDGGYSARDCKDGGYSARDCKDGGYSAGDCRDGGYSAGDCRDGGYSARDCKDGGYSVGQMKDGGFDALQMKDAGYTAAQLKGFGDTHTVEPIKVGGHIVGYKSRTVHEDGSMDEKWYRDSKLKEFLGVETHGSKDEKGNMTIRQETPVGNSEWRVKTDEKTGKTTISIKSDMEGAEGNITLEGNVNNSDKKGNNDWNVEKTDKNGHTDKAKITIDKKGKVVEFEEVKSKGNISNPNRAIDNGDDAPKLKDTSKELLTNNLTADQAMEHYQSKSGEPVRVNLNSLDLSHVKLSDFNEQGIAKVSLFQSDINDGLVHGTIMLERIGNTNEVQVMFNKDVNGRGGSFNFDMKSWDSAKNVIRNIATLGGKVVYGIDPESPGLPGYVGGKPFTIFYEGTVKIDK